MANDVHYIFVFSGFFLFLGLLAPFLNSEFEQDYTLNEFQEPNEGDIGVSSAWQIIGNIFLLPFWTFGFPAWVNLWLLLPIRLPFWFVLARNIWIGGGG